MNRTMVIGAVTNYTYKEIEVWHKSLVATGYTGKIALIVYNMKKADVDILEGLGITIFAFGKDNEGNLVYNGGDRFNIVVERFAHMWYFLGQIKDELDYVIATDVRDVVFQSNPVKNLFSTITVATENIRYKDEPWSKNNMTFSFGPMILDHLKDKEIICAGVIGGQVNWFLDLCLQVFLLCRGQNSFTPGGGGPDQAALNIILNSIPWKMYHEPLGYNDSFAVHMGTTLEGIKSGSGDIGLTYKNNPDMIKDQLIDKNEPVIVDGLVLNPSNGMEPYSIIHQYNRIPYLKELVEKRFT